MGTSNWQHIPYCVDAMMKIAPERVLDIGVGFGRWGIIAREFCDVWFGRVMRSDWKVRVEGVEAFPQNIDDYHAAFYDKIHLGDLRRFVPQFTERWNLIIFGDVLEHFEKQDALALLKWATDLSDYVMVNIPLGSHWEQGESYGNPYERHLSEWAVEEFEPFALRRHAIFHDYIDRPSGSFILSRNDPRGLTLQLFSRSTVVDPSAADEVQGNPSFTAERAELLARVQSLAGELEATRQELTSIKDSIGYRLIARIRRSKAFPLLHNLVRRVVRWRGHAVAPVPEAPSPAPSPPRWEFLEKDASHPVVAICHPRWQGVRSAAEGRTPNLLLVPEIEPNEAQAIVDRLRDSHATHFIADGFYSGYSELLTLMRRQLPNIRIHYVHHGSFYQMMDIPSLPSLLVEVSRLQQQRVIDRIGFCKAGMAEAFRRVGVPAHEVMNRVVRAPGPHIREWKSPSAAFIPVRPVSGKNPHTQLMAALLSKEFDEIHVAGQLDLRYLPASAWENVRLTVHDNLSREATWNLMQQCNLVLYVTLSECAPMVPLESLSVGVPCLTGNNHGLFDDYPRLAKSLFVSRSDDPWSIVETIAEVKSHYAECGEAIREFNEKYDREAQHSLTEFLGLNACWPQEAPALRRAAS